MVNIVHAKAAHAAVLDPLRSDNLTVAAEPMRPDLVSSDSMPSDVELAENFIGEARVGKHCVQALLNAAEHKQ